VHYPGGKGKSFQRLINLMPSHGVYIETHLGGGAVLRHKRPAHVNYGIDIDPAVIRRWQERYPNRCTLVNTDARTFLEGFSYTGDELIYADPPYVRSLRRKARIYRYDYELDQHNSLLQILKDVSCKVMLSGYDGALYEEALKGWRKVSFTAQSHVGLRTECVWMNFDQPSKLHDATFVGHTFRDRQTVRRRRSRLLNKFERMTPQERQHVLGLLNDRYRGDGT
jgi:DNA adenine methylase